MSEDKSLLADILEQHEKMAGLLAAGELDIHATARRKIEEALEVVSEHLHQVRPVTHQGRTELWSLCPFHDDRNVGSFSVDSSTGNYFCWVCGAHGGLVTLLKAFDLWTSGMRKALSGVDLSALLKSMHNQREEMGVEELTQLPEALLSGIKMYRPRRYLSKGHSRSIIDSMEVSYDPRHQRICFPVRSALTHLVGVQSRLAFDTQPGIRWKWYRFELGDLGRSLFEPDFIDEYEPPRRTVLYNEHRILQPLARGEIEELALVEGMGGALRSMATGMATVASFGTRLSKPQSFRLAHALRQAKEVRGKPVRLLLAHDGDSPGRHAAFEAFMALRMYADCYIPEIPDGKDPEDLTVGDLRSLYRNAGTLQDMLETNAAAQWREAFLEMAAKTNRKRQPRKKKARQKSPIGALTSLLHTTE